MKIVLKSILVFVILYLGFNIYSSARNNRLNDLYNNSIQDIYSDEIDSYVEKAMITNGVSRYINTPVFTINGESGFDFELRAYHFQKTQGKEVEEGIKFFLFDFKKENFDGFIKNEDDYEKDKSLAILSLRVNTDNSVNSKEISLGQFVENSKDDIPASKQGNTQTIDIYDNSIYFDFLTGLFYYRDSNGAKTTFNSMTNIEFNIMEKKDAKSQSLHQTTIGRITASDNVELFKSFKAVRQDNFFEVEGLNSNFEEYSKLRKRYNNTNDSEVLSVNLDLLNEYNGPMIRNTVVYAVFAASTIYAMFLHTPIKQRINHSKAIKQQQNK